MEEYIRYMTERFRDLGQKHPEQRDTLRALKLLSAAGDLPLTYDRLRAVLEHVFERASFHLGDCLEALANLAFLRSIYQDDIEPEPAYLIDAVTYTPSRGPEKDFPKLADVLENQLKDHEALVSLGFAYEMNLNDNEQALTCYERALKVNPDYTDAWNNMSVTLGKLGDFQGALEAIKEAAKLKPRDPDVWFHMGLAMDHLGVSLWALKFFENALEVEPDDPDAWYNKGVVLVKMGDWQEALKAVEEALRLESDYTEAWHYKGLILGRLGDWQEALKAVEEVLRLEPDYTEAWHYKGLILSELGRHNEAVKWLCKALHAWEEFPDKRDLVAETLRKLGHDPEECEKG